MLRQQRRNLGINVIVCWRGWHFKTRAGRRWSPWKTKSCVKAVIGWTSRPDSILSQTADALACTRACSPTSKRILAWCLIYIHGNTYKHRRAHLSHQAAPLNFHAHPSTVRAEWASDDDGWLDVSTEQGTQSGQLCLCVFLGVFVCMHVCPVLLEGFAPGVPSDLEVNCGNQPAQKTAHVKFKDMCDWSWMWQLGCSREDCFYTGWHLHCSGVAAHQHYEGKNPIRNARFSRKVGVVSKELTIYPPLLPTNIQTDAISFNVMSNVMQDIYQPGLMSISSDINAWHSPLCPSPTQKVPFGVRWGDTRVLTKTNQPYWYQVTSARGVKVRV